MSFRGQVKTYHDYGATSTQPLVGSSPIVTRTDLVSLDEGGEDNEGKIVGRRQIGVVSAVFIIFNRIIGTGVFSTPSTILTHSGSVGMTLTMWIIGAFISIAGMQVYITWGTVGASQEWRRKEFLFRRPKYLITSMYASNGVLLAWTAGNTLACSEYTLKALDIDPTRRIICFTSLSIITFAMLLHGTALKWGLRLQNFLGMFKLLVLSIIIITGFLALTGHIQIQPQPHNFQNMFEGTKFDASSLCICLYNILWSFVGFSNVNYALSEVKNPKRTLRIAGPLSVGIVTVLYLLTNIAYFAGASKEEITGSGRLVAALLFRNVYGHRAERVLSAFVALSALGNILAVIFSQGRVIQELGREGILPWSKLWASNRPFNAPLAGLWLHWFVCVITMFALPQGDAYNFVINTISYPLSVINALISFGIIYLSRSQSKSKSKSKSSFPQFTISPSTQLASLIYGSANIFLFLAPFIPPPPGEGSSPYEVLPYWTHAAGGWAVFGLGFLYWFLWMRVLPWFGRYRVVRVEDEERGGGGGGYGFRRIPV